MTACRVEKRVMKMKKTTHLHSVYIPRHVLKSPVQQKHMLTQQRGSMVYIMHSKTIQLPCCSLFYLLFFAVFDFFPLSTINSSIFMGTKLVFFLSWVIEFMNFKNVKSTKINFPRNIMTSQYWHTREITHKHYSCFSDFFYLKL